jgi:hypothetical protein
MNLEKLERFLDQVESFKNPNPEYGQYSTSSAIAGKLNLFIYEEPDNG